VQQSIIVAPEEQDVYSCKRPSKDFAPLGAKRGRTFADAEEIAFLEGLRNTRKGRQAINISPLCGEAANKFCCASNLI
jgi:hypothetical protein